VAGYPSKTHDAISTAGAMYQYFSTYGLIDEIISDPGTEFMNEVISNLNKWFGVHHVFSLVDRHESNGVEPTNREILRHLKALVMDERILNNWSDITVLPGIFWIINSQVSSESGVIPFHAHFGNQNATYFKIPDSSDQKEVTNEYVKLLSANLELINSISKRFQENLAAERTKDSLPEFQNQYQPGDFVLFQMNPEQHLPHKLHPKFKGPYEVVSQVKNDVECRDLIHGSISKFHVTRLKLFHGECSSEELKQRAFEMAQIDNNQYILVKIHGYRGDFTAQRKGMEFDLEFLDGSRIWKRYSKDIFDTEVYVNFINKTPELYFYNFTVEVATSIAATLKKSVISHVDVGTICYVDLRFFGCEEYENLGLKDYEYINYFVPFEYVEWKKSDHTEIEVYSELFLHRMTVNNLWIRQFGYRTSFVPTTSIIIDEQFILNHENAVPKRNRKRVIKNCKTSLGI
jgi:hypothetical protein